MRFIVDLLAIVNRAITINARLGAVPQVLKDSVRSRIRAAALRSFATRGYAGTTMAGVATEAGMATANLYRYYRNKAELFDDVVPDETVGALEQLVGRRLQDFAALVTRDTITPAVADEMMQFWLTHRLVCVVILAGATGTRHADVVRRLNARSVDALVNALPAHAVTAGDRAASPSGRTPPPPSPGSSFTTSPSQPSAPPSPPSGTTKPPA